MKKVDRIYVKEKESGGGYMIKDTSYVPLPGYDKFVRMSSIIAFVEAAIMVINNEE